MPMVATVLHPAFCLGLLLLCHPAEAAQARGLASARLGSSASAIPEWRVKAALAPAQTLETLAASGADKAGFRGANVTAENVTRDVGVGTTEAQDKHQCPLVKLTRLLNLHPGYASWGGQQGGWLSVPDSLTLGSWSQNFFAQNWQGVTISDANGRVALRIEETTDEELARKYQWREGAPPMSYANLSSLQGRWETAMYRTGFATENAAEDPSHARVLQMPGPSDSWKTFALFDCAGSLLFVAYLQASVNGFPGASNVYDRNGDLVVHTLADAKIARHLFVDPLGYLLATAEAPRLNDSIPYKDMPKDPARGGMLSYQLKIEEGGYANSSRLLETEYLWVLTAVAQLRAIEDGRTVWSPVLPQILPWAYWLVAASLALSATFVYLLARRLPAPPAGKHMPQVSFKGAAAPPAAWQPYRQGQCTF
mmetsp:Transcript_68245/g.222046  ORF Transcript_68245/g.222046 Transcript_68245/m.222046 type:complete len:424 (-) Transcript_68245:70-1341(-)